MQQNDSIKKNRALTARILAFEEDKTNRYLLEKVLSINGYIVDSVTSTSEVLGKLATSDSTYNLIIINVCAPIKDDLNLVRTIRSFPDKQISSIPILATTTAMHHEIKKKCRAEGVVDVIMKPYNIDEFSQIVKQYIQMSQQKSAN